MGCAFGGPAATHVAAAEASKVGGNVTPSRPSSAGSSGSKCTSGSKGTKHTSSTVAKPPSGPARRPAPPPMDRDPLSHPAPPPFPIPQDCPVRIGTPTKKEPVLLSKSFPVTAQTAISTGSSASTSTPSMTACKPTREAAFHPLRVVADGMDGEGLTDAPPPCSPPPSASGGRRPPAPAGSGVLLPRVSLAEAAANTEAGAAGALANYTAEAIPAPSELTGEAAARALGVGSYFSSGFTSTAASTPRCAPNDAGTTKGSGFEIDQELVDLFDEHEHNTDKVVLSEIETIMAGMEIELLAHSAHLAAAGEGLPRTRDVMDLDDEKLMLEILEDSSIPGSLETPRNGCALLA